MKITLSYQPQQLPPPFAYAAVMQLQTDNGEMIDVQFNLEYLDRDELSDDELRAEGFTRDDNFGWKGKLSSNWKADVENLTTQTFETTPHPDTYLHVHVDGTDYNFPKEIEYAEILFQELMQGILEQAKIEAPLELELKFDKESAELCWCFAERTIDLNGKTSTRWKTGRTLLKTIYCLDFEKTKAHKKAVSRSVNIGDGKWYEITNQALLSELEQLVNSLKS